MSKLGNFALAAASLILIGQGCVLGPATAGVPTSAPVPEEANKRSEALEIKDEAEVKKAEGTMMEEGSKVMMKGGVMMMEKNGRDSAMTDTMMTSDGSKAMMNGKVIMKNGEGMMLLKEGEGMTAKDGAMIKIMEQAMDKSTPVTVTKSFTLTAKQWSFYPALITVKKGDRVKLAIKSVDVTHGFKLSAFNINQNLEPGQEVTVEFTADKTGSFSFSCSVFCGSGHGGMRGTLVVE